MLGQLFTPSHKVTWHSVIYYHTSKISPRTLCESGEHIGVGTTLGDEKAAVRSSSEARDPFYSKMFRTTLGLIHLRFSGVKWPYEANHLPPSRAEINRTWRHSFTLPKCLSGVSRDNFSFKFHDRMFLKSKGVSPRGAVGWGTVLLTGSLRIRFPMVSL